MTFRSSSPAVVPTALLALRQTTAGTHTRLDADLHACGAFGDPRAAARMLVATARVLVPLEARYEARLGLVPRGGAPVEALLADDLARLGHPELDRPGPAVSGTHSWLAVAYVVEGSALGAPTVQRELARGGLGASAVVARVLDPAVTRQRWQALLKALRAHGEVVDPAFGRAAEAVFCAYRGMALEDAR